MEGFPDNMNWGAEHPQGPDEEIVKIENHKVYDTIAWREVQFGQHNPKNELSGIGRKMWVYSHGAIYIWEGQFE